MENPISLNKLSHMVLNSECYVVGTRVRLTSEYGSVTGHVSEIGTWSKPYNPDTGQVEKYPYVRVKYDRPGLFKISECWLSTDEHFKTMKKMAD